MRRVYWWAWHKRPVHFLARNRRFVNGWRAVIVRRLGVPGLAYYPATGEQDDNVKIWWLWMAKEEG